MKKTRENVRIGLMAAVIAVLSQIMIPLPSGVPLTAQTFAVALSGFVLGPEKGAAAVGVYLAVGAVGAPVFTGMMGGPAKLFGVTGGFLLGFLPMAFFCGAAEKKKNRFLSCLLSAIGMCLCHLMGTAYYAFLAKTGLLSAFAAVSLPYLLKDALSLAAAHAVSKGISRALSAAG